MIYIFPRKDNIPTIVTISFTQLYVKGILNGRVRDSKRTFSSRESAKNWLASVRENKALPYILINIHIETW